MPAADKKSPAFVPPEVDFLVSEEMYELEGLFTGASAIAKHFRRHSHLFNAAHSYASLKRKTKQRPLGGA